MVGPNLVFCKITKTLSPIKGRKPALPHTRAGEVPHGGVPFYLLILRQPCYVVQAGLELSVLLFVFPSTRITDITDTHYHTDLIYCPEEFCYS